MKTRTYIMAMVCGVAAILLPLTGCTSKSTEKNESEISSVTIKETENNADADSGATEWHDGLPTVIDFYATWCGPCKQIAPLFDQLKAQYGESINFCRVDVDADAAKAEEYQIQAMPTFVFLDKDGNEVDRIVGADPEALRKAVEALKTKN